MTDENNANAKTTVAVLGVKMDYLTNTVEAAVGKMDAHLGRTTEVEKCIAVLAHDFENLDEKVDDINERNKKYNIGTAIGAGFASAFATLMAILGYRS